VRMFEAAGADGVQIEDQAEVKPADAMATRPLVPLEVMAGKLKAAQDARRSDQTAISARTDAVSTAGFDEALRRAAAFVEIG
ncbi:isocitrate lyase/phosphoenolpyruvate mutase family protein, partial [Klebsiella michiganensis]|uniref:isocitrate lyase/phosphoenolpyruvate mutase family protein n=3 Tax=Pseudomonadota TaxID=1224 RepID=UPI001953932D